MMQKMKNIDFLAKTVMTPLTDNELQRLYDLVWNEMCDRHLLHGKCTPDNCIVIEDARNKFADIANELYLI